MANPERGEVAIEVDGVSYTLKLTTNAAAVLEARHKKSLGAMLRDADGLDVVTIRGIVWVLLQKHHANRFKTEEQVGDFIDDAGGIAAVTAKIGEVLAVNADPNRSGQAMSAGTGTSSILALVESA